MDQSHDSIFVDEVPRFWFSRRWRLAAFACIALLIVTSQRVCMDVALVSMLNRTSTPTSAAVTSSFRPVTIITTTTATTSTATTSGRRVRAMTSHAADVTASPRTPRHARGNATGRHHVTATPTATPGGFNVSATTTTTSRVSLANVPCHNLSEVDLLTITLFTYQNRGDIVWTEEQTAGVVDAFFWGDVLGRIPAGLLSQRHGGKRILGFGLLLASLCTVLIPLTARVHFSLVVFLRFVTGCAAGSCLPAVSYLLGRWSPPEERSLLFSIANTGTYVCAYVVLVPLAGLLCEYGFDGGWPSVFYVFGGLGMLWFVLWMLLTADSPMRDGGISREEREFIVGCLASQTDGFNTDQDVSFPWTVALTSLPLFAISFCQFTHDWVVFVLLFYVPVYFREFLHIDIKSNTVCAMLPGIGFWCLMLVSAGAADRLQAYGVLTTPATRRIMQSIGAVVVSGMVASLTALSDCNVHWVGPLSMLVLGLSFSGVQLGSGAPVAHLDLASRHAAVVAGLSGALGAATYFAVPSFRRLLIGIDLQFGDSEWRTLFIFTAASHIATTLFFDVFGSTGGRAVGAVTSPHPGLGDGSTVIAAPAAAESLVGGSDIESPGTGSPSSEKFQSVTQSPLDVDLSTGRPRSGAFRSVAPHGGVEPNQLSYYSHADDSDLEESIDDYAEGDVDGVGLGEGAAGPDVVGRNRKNYRSGPGSRNNAEGPHRNSGAATASFYGNNELNYGPNRHDLAESIL